LTDDGYRQLMKHAKRLAQEGHGELAQHLRDAIDLRAEVEALKAEDARLRKTWQKENDELVQILGKALQYPRFVDDQSVFPGATEADGVCVPCHTALSIADEAAEKIEALKAELARLTPMMRLEPTGWEFLDWIEPDFLTSIPQGTQLYMIDAARAAHGERIDRAKEQDGGKA